MMRSPLTVAAVASALALVACGGGSNDNGGSGSGTSGADKAFDGALKFAKCMRDHGLDFPDPVRSSTGGHTNIRIGPGPGKGGRFNRDDPKMKAAQKACEKFLVAGGGAAPDPAAQAKARDAFVQYARCMRSKGINIPDPRPGAGGGIVMRAGGPGQTDPASPAFKAADKACHRFLAAIEKAGPMTEKSR
jgi:hypothetical protein